MPPLRERRDEIPHLTDFFIDRYARRYNRPVRQLSDELRQLFQTYEWPGNIRELENMIKRIVILQDEQLVVREIERNMQRARGRARGRRRGAPRPACGRRRCRGRRRDAAGRSADGRAGRPRGARATPAAADDRRRLARRRRQGRRRSKPSAR